MLGSSLLNFLNGAGLAFREKRQYPYGKTTPPGEVLGTKAGVNAAAVLVEFPIDHAVAAILDLDGKSLVNPSEGVVPLLQRTVKHRRIHAHEHISRGVLPGEHGVLCGATLV